MSEASMNPLRVWWIPQIPMKPFYWPVATLAEAKNITELLAEYDQFQFDNNIKPDYSNVGGIEEYLGPINPGDDGWYDLDDEDDDEPVTFDGREKE